MTGTAQWGPNTYDHIKEEVTVFQIPGELVDSKGKSFYISEHWNDKTIEQMKRNYGQFYPAFINMENVPRDTKLELVTDNSFLFAYADETNVPTHVQKIDKSLKQLLKSGCVVTSKDPSYSSSHAKSLDATATGVVSDGALFMIHAQQVAGASGDNSIDDVIFAPILDQIDKYASDVFIQDAQGNQKVLAQIYARRLKELYPNIKCVPYTKPPVSGTKSKSERAQVFLSDLFNMNKIRVHWRQQRLIDEIMRTTLTFDFIDVLIQVVAIVEDFDYWSSIYKNRKHSGLFALEGRPAPVQRKKQKRYAVVNY